MNRFDNTETNNVDSNAYSTKHQTLGITASLPFRRILSKKRFDTPYGNGYRFVYMKTLKDYVELE